jgi:diadenosine tetraphosphate (Ap4A) HIT family hydrolase
MPFALHPNLESTSAFVADLPLSQARLQLDARFPWLVLIPRREDLSEIDDLLIEERASLIEEIARASAAVRLLGSALNRPVEKINIGALGNVTPQLHVHVLGRRVDDGLWPDPVWGRGTALAYEEAALARALDVVRRALAS